MLLGWSDPWVRKIGRGSESVIVDSGFVPPDLLRIFDAMVKWRAAKVQVQGPLRPLRRKRTDRFRSYRAFRLALQTGHERPLDGGP